MTLALAGRWLLQFCAGFLLASATITTAGTLIYARTTSNEDFYSRRAVTALEVIAAGVLILVLR